MFDYLVGDIAYHCTVMGITQCLHCIRQCRLRKTSAPLPEAWAGSTMVPTRLPKPESTDVIPEPVPAERVEVRAVGGMR